jgi:diguanylate cyclase (GGDEF)-like protein/PAS domain S-box-containing protein
VLFNFASLNSLSHSLIDDNIKAAGKLFTQIIKTPIIVNDLATLDNAVDNFSSIKYVASVEIINNQNILLSKSKNDDSIYKYIFHKNINRIEINNRVFRLKTIIIKIGNDKIASAKIIFEITDVLRTIQHSKYITFLLFLFATILSFIIAYIFGHRLTNRLDILTSSAVEISKNDKIIIPDIGNYKDEVSILANALRTMQEKIHERSKELRKERDFHTALVNNSSSAVIVLNNKGEIITINHTVEKLTGYTKDELEGKLIWNILIDKSIKKEIKTVFNNLVVDDFPNEYENALISKTNASIPFEWSNSCILNEAGDIEYVISIGVDISTIKKAQKELEKYNKLVDENILISRTDLDGIITYVSEAFCKTSGFSSEELVGHSHNIIRHPDTNEEVYKNLWHTILSGEIWHKEVKNRTKNGGYFWADSIIYPDHNHHGIITGYYAIRHDITNKKLLEEISITDPLTKLYNRRHFDAVFDKEVNRAKREKNIFCLLSLDIDFFKKYNDTYGHQEGDRVLATVSKILKSHMKRSSDIAFRMGGEEFSAIFSERDKNSVSKFTENIRKDIENAKILHKENSASEFVTASFGVIYIDFQKENDIIFNQDTLYKDADDLLYQAKNSGRNKVIIKEKVL